MMDSTRATRRGPPEQCAVQAADAGQMEDVNAEESNRNLKRHKYLPAQFVCRAPTLRAVAMSDAGVRLLMECRRE